VQLVCLVVIPARSNELDGAKPVLRTLSYYYRSTIPSIHKPTYGFPSFLLPHKADLGLNILMLKRLPTKWDSHSAFSGISKRYCSPSVSNIGISSSDETGLRLEKGDDDGDGFIMWT